ncbi:DUF3348 domain-containing protein [Pseudoxanthomonas wuyuanensis]|uniref:DUF3348 domain-containing protein n=1 Tax=Pseudoxanthomonas wuyuanensis TaxID=1073196 RepID=UPI000BE36C0F|nr:DUF3348 domain-containing protein [Pseudoxanthomonas wuyuanensis]KAF1720305.1 DUF3348 domain-containing protein [Pseudoxanthomonas wuyuanensis]
MLEASQRALVRGPTFIRLLARLTDGGVPPSCPSLPERLSEWIDWTRAVALSRVLDGRPAAAGPAGPVFDGAEEAACADARATLTGAIACGDGLAAPAHSGPAGLPGAVPGVPAEADYAVFRKHYLAMQRAMLTATGRLRGRLRDMLARTSADMARLAELDAFMEQVLSPREQALLATVPNLLGEHFERLRLAAHEVRNNPQAPGDAEAWLDVFRRDMQNVLLAELDVRFLPLEGLLAALRSHSQGRHVQISA